MKFMSAFVTVMITLSTIAYGQNIVTPNNLMKENLASEFQTRQIHDLVKEKLNFARFKEEFVVLINRQSVEFDLPQIEQTSSDLEVEITLSVGFGSSFPLGVKIVDGKHKYCFPCQSGLNVFEYGIVTWRKSERNVTGKYYEVIEALDEITSYHQGISVNSWDWPSQRHAILTVKNSKRTGVLVLYDDLAEFFDVPFPEDKLLPSPEESIILSKSTKEIYIKIWPVDEGQYFVGELSHRPKEMKVTQASKISSDDVQEIISSLFEKNGLETK